jgi:uncharacterized membrane protein
LMASKREETSFHLQEIRRRAADQRKEDHNSRFLTCLYIHFNLILIKSINKPFHILKPFIIYYVCKHRYSQNIFTVEITNEG